MSTTTVNGTTLYYEEVGQGPAALVLHGGLGLDHTSYRGLDALSDRLRLVYFDQRANGRSERAPLDTLTMEQLADDAVALAVQLDASPAIVIGHSYGGFVAQELALRHPEHVTGLVLVDTTPGQLGASDSPDDDQGPPPPPEWIEIAGSVPADDAELAANMGKLLPHFLADQANLAAAQEAMGQTIFNVGAMVRSMEVLAGWSAADRLAEIQVPTLVIVGSHDRISSPAQSRRIARRIPHAQVVEMEHSGHFPWVEEPDRFTKIVREWL
jgi:proline iminopeptidase